MQEKHLREPVPHPLPPNLRTHCSSFVLLFPNFPDLIVTELALRYVIIMKFTLEYILSGLVVGEPFNSPPRVSELN